MSENSITPITGVRAPEADLAGRAQLSVSLAKNSAPKQKPLETVERAAENQIDKPAESANVSLRFQVGNDNGQLTVFVIDRASRRVLRSIPASEFYKLEAGDLLKLTT